MREMRGFRKVGKKGIAVKGGHLDFIYVAIPTEFLVLLLFRYTLVVDNTICFSNFGGDHSQSLI